MRCGEVEPRVLDGPGATDGRREEALLRLRAKPSCGSAGEFERLCGAEEWTLRVLDDALLDGEGAKGSLDRKSDDTFEILLLMGLEGD